MTELDFRTFAQDDLRAALGAVKESWPDLGSVLPEAYLQAEIELFWSLATTAEAVYVGPDFAGLLLGKIRSDPRSTGQLRLYGRLLRHTIKIAAGRHGPIEKPLRFAIKYLTTEVRALKHRPKADAEILLLMVVPRYQRQGIGTQLVNRFFSKAKRTGALSVCVCTEEASDWRFYESYGFSKWSDFYDDLDSEILNHPVRAFYYLKEVPSDRDENNNGGAMHDVC